MASNYFTDRVVQYPGRVIMTPVQGEANTYDMSRAEGAVTTAGTSFNASTFNQIADDIIQVADDNIITDSELTDLGTKLNVTAKLHSIIDAIITRLKSAETAITNLQVEEGTVTAGSVTWKYKKYKNKTLEMWGTVTTSLAISTAAGAIFTTVSEYDVAMPSFVNGVDILIGELSGGGWVDTTAFTVPPKIRLYAPSSYASGNRTIRYYFRGTWA